MKKAILIVVAMLFLSALTSVSFIAEATEATSVIDKTDKTKKPKKVTGQKKIKQVTGEVTALDTTARTLTVQGITMIADEKTISDIKVGDKVAAKYITKGRNVAICIIRE